MELTIPQQLFEIIYEMFRRHVRWFLQELAVRENIPAGEVYRRFAPTRAALRVFLARHYASSSSSSSPSSSRNGCMP